jgi:hypothetical protein
MIHHKSFEISLPRSKELRLSFKNDIVSLITKAPGTNHKNFHEERLTKNELCLQKLMVNAQIFLPNNSQSKPSTGSSRTVEKEMGSSFLLTALAHHTVVSFVQHFLSSSQNIPRI